MRKNTAFFLFMTLIFFGCGGSSPTPNDGRCEANSFNSTFTQSTDLDPCDDFTPPPAPQTDTGSTSNMARHALIKASHEVDENFAGYHIADGEVGTADGKVYGGFIWSPGDNATSSSVELSWNSPIQVSSIELFDNPNLDHHVLGGRIDFSNSESDVAIDSVDFEALPNDAKSSLKVSGPSTPITKMVIRISKAKGNRSGFAEVYVMGKRTSAEIKLSNLERYADVIGGHSEVFAPLNPELTARNTGPFRIEHVVDGKRGGESDRYQSFVANGTGENTQLQLKFDVSYDICKIVLHDRVGSILNGPDGAEVSGGSVTFVEAQRKIAFGEEESAYEGSERTLGSFTLKFLEPIRAKTLKIQLSKILANSGKDAGLSEVEVIGSYQSDGSCL